MRKGISIYLGLDKSWEENKKLMEQAADLGFTEVFLSLHIPEADAKTVEAELQDVVTTAGKLGLSLMADIDAATQVAEGIEQVRLDDGFTPAMMAQYLEEHPGHKIILNASTVNGEILENLQDLKVDFTKVGALHNFYPRPWTGIGAEFLQKQNALLQKYGIEVGAFVPSQTGKRGPLFKGLPTLESCRNATTDFAARFLAALGLDSIYIGDSGPSTEELEALAQVEAGITLRMVPFSQATWLGELLSHTFTTRADESECVVRAVEGRSIAKDFDIPVENALDRHMGCVTMDNNKAGRYKGELEIVLPNLPADPTVNVLGLVPPDELMFLNYRKPGSKFRFRIFTPEPAGTK